MYFEDEKEKYETPTITISDLILTDSIAKSGGVGLFENVWEDVL